MCMNVLLKVGLGPGGHRLRLRVRRVHSQRGLDRRRHQPVLLRPTVRHGQPSLEADVARVLLTAREQQPPDERRHLGRQLGWALGLELEEPRRRHPVCAHYLL